MASFYGPTSPVGANDGDDWTNQTTGETRVYRGGSWRSSPVTAAADTALTAGGALAVSIGSAAAPNLYFGSGAPTVSAPQGSLYLRTDGSSTSTRAYVNSNGSTTWTAITTAG